MASLKALYDQKKWSALEDEAAKDIKENATGALYAVKARAEAEIGNWKAAKQTLSQCAEQMKDNYCVASLLQTGYMGSHLNQYTELLEDKLKTESQAPWLIGMAQADVRLGKFKEAFQFGDDGDRRPTRGMLPRIRSRAGCSLNRIVLSWRQSLSKKEFAILTTIRLKFRRVTWNLAFA